MKKTVLLSGGNPSTRFFREACRLSGRENPNVLLFATALDDREDAVRGCRNFFEPLTKNLVAVTVLTKKYTDGELKELFENADILYACGGMTENLDRAWKAAGLFPLIKAAYERGAVLCGASAGAMCWCHSGWNDFENPDGSMRYGFYQGPDFLHVRYAPHYNGGPWLDATTAVEKEDGSECGILYAMENGSNLVFFDGQPAYFFSENDTEKCYVRRWNGQKWEERELFRI